MSEINKLIEEIIQQRPDIDEKKIRNLINEKKKTVGSGYLTDSGAVYLVASDLNVIIKINTASDILLKDVYIGANEINIVGRVFTVSPIKVYNKKDGKGRYRRITIFDKDAFIVVIFWDNQVDIIDNFNVKQDQLIRIKKCYVKSGLDNLPVINIGKNGSIENIDDKDISYNIPFIKDIIRDVSSVNTPEVNLALTGLISSTPRISEFTKNGKPGKVLSIYMTNTFGGKNFRVSIWNNDFISNMDIPRNSIVKLVGLKSRFSKEGQIEIHGDENTTLEILSLKKSFNESTIDKFRLLSIGKIRVREDGSTSISLLIINKSKEFYTLILKDEVTEVLSELKLDIIIECEFNELSPFTFICNKKSSFKIINKEDSSFLKLHNIKNKISDITDSTKPHMLDVISLSKTTIQDIVTKNGETIKKAEVLIGDETKEIKLVAWRDLSDILLDIIPGQRLRLIGVVLSKGLGGSNELLVKSYSNINKKLDNT